MADKLFRLNTRVSLKLNDWLDTKSSEMGISKSALVAIAIENYRMQMETVDVMPDLLNKLKEIEIKISQQQCQ